MIRMPAFYILHLDVIGVALTASILTDCNDARSLNVHIRTDGFREIDLIKSNNLQTKIGNELAKTYR